jgi:limonene-1,2-epoxide hydrolase
MGTLEAQNRQVVERYWEAHFARDWERMATFFAVDAHYTDVGLGDPGATGPDEIIARLKLGIEPLARYHHHPRHTLAEGDLVVTEHVEEWLFHTGENVMHPFVSIMEVRERLIVRWHDYSHLQNLTANAPAWWLEHIAKGWREPATDA